MRKIAAIAMIAGGAVGCAGSGAGAGAGSAGAEPAPVALPALAPQSSRPLPDRFGSLGVTGVNKPNGLEYRLRQSIPDDTPPYVPRQAGAQVLWIADPVPEGWLALYRTPMDAAPLWANGRFRAVLYGAGGEMVWGVDLDRFFSRPDHLEVQDIRFENGELYFNEACQTYARDAGFRCSALLRVDPRRGSLVWRTAPLVSSDIFILHGPVVIAGYGFTAEPDSLFLVSRETGAVVDRVALDSAHDYLEVTGDRLTVVTASRVYEFDLGGR
ncbi:MAG TPA: hypothetical protein VFZ18_10015 [Longimicrobiaceae bacterium]